MGARDAALGDAAPVVELRGVRKRFGNREAVQGLELVIPRGATYGLLGPNGAGKTTAIRMLLRILEPDAGEIRVFGEPVSQAALDRIGYVPEERGLYRRMRVRRLLAFLAELKGIPARESARRIEHWLERMGLADRAEARVQELSKGNQQKLQFIAAVLHEPEILILDEPFSGLDPINQQELREVILELRRQGRTILFSTHILEHAERLCDHVCILARGRKVLDGPLAAVKQEHGGDYVTLTPERWEPEWLEALRRSPLVAGVREQGSDLEVALRSGADAQALLADLIREGVRLRRFARTEASLEQIFLDRVGVVQQEAEVVHV
ncbi:MAG TPA: ATP-binding cassette domain-containing protein [Longimicrobiales bacterium]